jgi:hypothetical protein
MNMSRSRLHSITLGMAMVMITVSGCALGPPPAITSPGAAAGGLPTPPMTLPRYLGLHTVASGCRRVVYRSRVCLSSYLPFAAPQPAAAAPVAICDPACLQSPSPAVATAASIQQAEAAAPAKIQALGFLATQNMCRNPQVEEAFLAAMDDASDSVRIAAVQGVLNSKEACGCCANPCASCCTPAVQSKLYQMAYSKDDRGCWCEPNAKARRLARLAACACNATEIHSEPGPEEVPAQFLIDMQNAATKP